MHIRKIISQIASKTLPKEIQFTGSAATQVVYTPSYGKALRIKFIIVTSDSDVRLNFFWNITFFMSIYVPGGGTIVSNLIDSNIQSLPNEKLVVQASGPATVHLTILGEEV